MFELFSISIDYMCVLSEQVIETSKVFAIIKTIKNGVNYYFRKFCILSYIILKDVVK
jgi:hypothetical protein